ncbi:PilZ domain-containing protein [Methylophaga thiooxydans]|uniref:Type IV pilus assembly protein PilZ n=1 Tax=Methylophaga thiooxydans DMS010 TaxID=637616 RepID=C0N9C2_9GAMM|nr:PilZ domain-containing protein [Methylophaga thiooxydans]EEF78705.1 Type IV pilus assembly protein PilZ [Methylophaga thiooxydans DMS010]
MIDEPREFIRHPSAIPIHFTLGQRQATRTARDVCSGGLCFHSAEAVAVGETIEIEIASCKPTFTAQGVVRWCEPEHDAFLVGVAFTEKSVRFAVRMVEQLCYIEDYRQKKQAETGQSISSQQAALQWIKNHAATFPDND